MGGAGCTRKTSSHNFLLIEPFFIVPFKILSAEFEQGLFVMKEKSEGVRRGERGPTLRVKAKQKLYFDRWKFVFGGRAAFERSGEGCVPSSWEVYPFHDALGTGPTKRGEVSGASRKDPLVARDRLAPLPL